MKYKYIFIGTSRSGKSTIGKRLAGWLNGTFLDVVDYVLRFIKRKNLVQSKFGTNLLRGPYEDLCHDLAKGKKWDVLEVASDYPEEFLPKIFSVSPPSTILIFCDCPPEVCLARNTKNKRVVPKSVILNQSKYDESYYKGLAHHLGVKLVVLDSTQPAPLVFRSLLHKLEEIS